MTIIFENLTVGQGALSDFQRHFPVCPRGSTQYIYRKVSPIFLGSNIAESAIFGPIKTEITFMIFFVVNYCCTDISEFLMGNYDVNLHCFMIYHIHAEVSKYRMS